MEIAGYYITNIESVVFISLIDSMNVHLLTPVYKSNHIVIKSHHEKAFSGPYELCKTLLLRRITRREHLPSLFRSLMKYSASHRISLFVCSYYLSCLRRLPFSPIKNPPTEFITCRTEERCSFKSTVDYLQCRF